jgi:hypothetical protein
MAKIMAKSHQVMAIWRRINGVIANNVISESNVSYQCLKVMKAAINKPSAK